MPPYRSRSRAAIASAHGACTLRAVRAVQDQPPVAEFVAEPLEHQRPVVGQVPGRLALAGQVRQQVGRGQLVEPVRA